MLRTSPSPPSPVAVARLLPDPAAPASCHQIIFTPQAAATASIAASDNDAVTGWPSSANTHNIVNKPLDAANIR